MPSKRVIRVQVVGSAASGKSGIAEMLAQILTAAGFAVKMTDDNGIGMVDERPGVIAASYAKRVNAARERGTSIEIQTINVRRGAHEHKGPAAG